MMMMMMAMAMAMAIFLHVQPTRHLFLDIQVLSTTLYNPSQHHDISVEDDDIPISESDGEGNFVYDRFLNIEFSWIAISTQGDKPRWRCGTLSLLSHSPTLKHTISKTLSGFCSDIDEPGPIQCCPFFDHFLVQPFFFSTSLARGHNGPCPLRSTSLLEHLGNSVSCNAVKFVAHGPICVLFIHFFFHLSQRALLACHHALGTRMYHVTKGEVLIAEGGRA